MLLLSVSIIAQEAAAWVVVGFVGLLGLAIIVLIARGQIDLRKLLCEPTGEASTSRLQLLVFTFVIALSFFILTMKKADATFAEVPVTVLGLLGVSAGSYLVSKGIQFSNPEGTRRPILVVTPASATAKIGSADTVQFLVIVRGLDSPNVTWILTPPGIGTIGQTGLYSPPAAAPAPPVASVNVTARSTADATLSDTAVVTLS